MSKIARAVQRTLAAHARKSGGRVRGYDDGSDVLPDVGEPLIGGGREFSPGTRGGNRLFGTGSEERHRLWPEVMARSGISLAGDILSGSQKALPPGLRREDYTDIPPPSGPTKDSTWLGRKLGVAPVQAQPNDEMMERAQDMAGLAGGQTLLTGRAAPPRKIIKETAHEPAIPTEAATVREAPVDVPGGLAGAPGGDAGLRAAQLQAERWAGERAALEGLPVKPQIVDGDWLIPGPVAKAHDVAEMYMQGRDYGVPHPDRYHPIDTEHAVRIAQAFEDMPHAPKDLEVRAAYEALAQETLDQYRAIREHGGLQVTPVNGADYPYHGNPRAVVKDVADNNHMAFFKTNEGFGTNFHADPDHVLLRSSGEKVGEHDMLYNDLFRVVHDYFGHVKNGNGFRGAGEDNAWRAHAAMYSPLARRAMTTETRGQNSWLNYGPHGEKNRTANAADTIYADQKIGLMPEWTMHEPGWKPTTLLEDSATAGAALAGLEKSSGVHYAPPKREPQYYEHELNTSGNPIINKGVENPPDPRVQTVAEPHRMMFPGIYGNPREIAARAAAQVGAEDPAMKRLFNVTRGEMREMAQGRVGNEEPALKLAQNPRGSVSAQNIQTPQNTQRLVDILGEAGKHEGLRTADAWYIQDPVYNRMKELGSNDPAAQYRRFNTMTAMASPGSDVMTEIQRGTAAHWLHKTGRFGDFQKYAGVPEDMRGRVKFPADMRYVAGHPYHRTSQGDPMAKYLEHGEIKTDAAKVPLYAHASGTPETGFQTKGPVGDAHFSRGVGLADTRKGPTDVGSSFSRAEYQTLQPWWQHDVAGKVGLESVPAQARLWTVLGPQTGVFSELGAPKLELLAKQMMETSRRLRISPEKARDLVLSGKAGAGARGGAVGPRFAEGGGVGDDYNTPVDEGPFQSWKALIAPNDSGVDYDLRGAYQAGEQPAEDGHMTDRFKKPNHPTFSDQSQYATGDQRARAGHWSGETFVPPPRFAEGGALPPAPWGDDTAPTKEALPAAPWDTGAPSVPISGPDAPIAAPSRTPAKPQGPALLEAGKGAARGPLSFIGDMGEAVMGPFGPSKHAANLYSTITGGPRPTPDEPYSTQLHKAAGVDSANPGYSGSVAETVTNPASWIGPGGPVAKGVVAAASGAGGQYGSDLTEGSPLGRAGGALLAGPLAARAIKPQLAPAQQMLSDARVPMTPGQLPGGILKNLEDKLTSIPLLGHFITNARTRSVEGFNRSVGNQALEPIGGQIPAGTQPGHQMVAQVEHQLGAAYDRVVPHLQFAPDRQFAMEMLAIHQRNHGQLPPAQLEQFNRIITSSFGRGGNMTGQKIKTIEEELGKIGRNYSSSPMPAERDLGYAVTDTLRALRGNLERVNPQHADELQRINAGWAMYVRMRDAASRRVTSEGVFMPSDLLAAVKRGDRSVGKGSFARGDALMQDFAEAGQHVLPSKVPDSGTPGRALAAAATGALGGGHLAGYIPAKALAAIGAATQLYTRPSTWLLNNYARPTAGVRAGYSAAGRGAGTAAAPLASNPFGDEINPYAP